MRWRVEHNIGVSRVKRRLEERAVDCFEEDGWLDALRFGIDKVLAQRVDHRADEEVSAELDSVRLARLRADDGEAAAERLKQRASLVDGCLRSGSDDPQAPFLGDVGTSKDRRANIGLIAASVLGGEAFGERN